MRNRCKLQTIDVCLIVFMTVLFGQMVYSLFFGDASTNNATLDIAFRTTAAAIFGYFLSANFTTREMENCEEEMTAAVQAQQLQQSQQSAQTPPQGVRNQIGFHTPSDDLAPSVGKAFVNPADEASKQAYERVSNLQVLIASCFGLAALAVLILARNMGDISSSTTATISQMRDFFSGCIGFLLGSKNTP